MRTFNELAPANDDKEGLGAEELRGIKQDFKDRMELDHQFGTSTTITSASCDGYHKQITMKALAADPTAMTDAGRLYTKVGSSGLVELFYINDDGDVIQITHNDSLAVRLSYNSAILSGGVTSADITPTAVKFSPEVFDILSEYNISNGRFTAAKNGGYLIMVNTANAVTVTLKVSGTTISSITTTAGGQAMFSQTLTAGQYVEIFVDSDIGSASSLNIARLF